MVELPKLLLTPIYLFTGVGGNESSIPNNMESIPFEGGDVGWLAGKVSQTLTKNESTNKPIEVKIKLWEVTDLDLDM